MKKTINVCDRCEHGACLYDSVEAEVGNHGPETDDTRAEHVDLCPLCMRAVMQQMVRAMTHEQARAWVALARTKKQPVRLTWPTPT